MKLQGSDRAVIKRAVKALEEAIFKFQQHDFDDNEWIEEMKLAALALEDLLE